MRDTELQDDISSVEKRASERRKLIVDVHFSGGDATGIANTRDIGIGGMYMTTSTDLAIGTPVALSLVLAGKEVFLRGIVIYTDLGQGAGIRFTDLSPEAEAAIIKTIDS